MTQPTVSSFDGGILTSSELNVNVVVALQWLLSRVTYAQRATAQTYDSTTTLQDDTVLQGAVDAYSTYLAIFGISALGTAGDIKFDWDGPSGVTGYRVCIGPTQTSTDRTNTSMRSAFHAFATDVQYGTSDATNGGAILEVGVFTTDATAGTLILRHAQYTSNAAPSGTGIGSFMLLVKLSGL